MRSRMKYLTGTAGQLIRHVSTVIGSVTDLDRERGQQEVLVMALVRVTWEERTHRGVPAQE